MLDIKGKNIILNNGKEMPLVGLGCWLSVPGDIAKAVEVALDSGYRHIDTAFVYKNEKDVGDGIKNWLKKSSSNKREDLFVVTKLPPTGMSKEGVEKYLKISLQKLNLSYVDLYLVHGPIGLKSTNDEDPFPKIDGKLNFDLGTDLISIWKAMETMVDNGLAKSIGVSNFVISQIRKINANARIPPVTNQVEMNVYYQQKELQDYCNEHDMVITAYGGLGSPGRSIYGGTLDQPPKVLEDPVILLVANNHKVTAAQVLIKYLLQLGVAVIPKSINPERIKSNMDVYGFTLSALEMAAIKGLDKGKAGRTFKMEVMFEGIEVHPEFLIAQI